MADDNRSETDRLKKVYDDYRTSTSVQARWNLANPGNNTINQERCQAIRQIFRSASCPSLSASRVLDIGCGNGDVLANLIEMGAQTENLYGVDLLITRLQDAKKRYPHIAFQCGNAERLPFADGFFNIILFFTVFSSILNSAMQRNVAREANRLLAPGGVILWYDFRYNNPMNPHVRAIRYSDIQNLFKEFDLHLFTITLLPPLARRFGRYTYYLYPKLVRLLFLRTHFIGLLLKK
ncbi:class I SAM-dependent methyltransferase [Desulfococcaceae bacterium HSG9]|nr:class I SAM-dependent methyltransferase [Desulfococcaceae bacterium HSG9]